MAREYDGDVSFFTGKGDQFTTVGDWLGRLTGLDLARPKRGEIVIDAGCGAGWVTRRVARMASPGFIRRYIHCLDYLGLLDWMEHDFVYGMDMSEKMLKAADRGWHPGIQYLQRDITKDMAMERYGKVDLILCIAVAMHLSPGEISLGFLPEAYKTLKPGGRLLISTIHPDLYHFCNQSPNKPRWISLEPIGNNPDPNRSSRYTERYVDKLGQVFTAEIWRHPEEFFRQSLAENGFALLRQQTTFVTREVVNMSPFWDGSPVGHPAFLQLLAQKPL